MSQQAEFLSGIDLPVVTPVQERLARRQFMQYLQAQKAFDVDLAKVLYDASADAVVQIGRVPNNFSGSVRAQQYSNASNTLLRRLYGDVTDLIETGQEDVANLARSGALDFARHLGEFSPADFDGLLEYTNRLAENVSSRLLNEIPLSSSVYRTEALSRRWVAREINRGIAQGQSSKELAARVRSMILPNTRGGVSYAASRLGRTEINNAFHNTSKRINEGLPWVTGVKWYLSGSHPRSDKCDDYANEDSDNLGEGIFKPGNVPSKPHPQ